MRAVIKDHVVNPYTGERSDLVVGDGESRLMVQRRIGLMTWEEEASPSERERIARGQLMAGIALRRRAHMMRAKFKVETVTQDEHGEVMKARAVHSSDNPEDNSYAKATPNGDLTMRIDNPSWRGLLKPGDKFYMDFTKAD